MQQVLVVQPSLLCRIAFVHIRFSYSLSVLKFLLAMALLNLETSPILDQVASAVLDLQGNVVATTSTQHFIIDTHATKLLYQIFTEVGSLHLPTFRRITISSSSSSSMSVNENNINAETNSSGESIRYIMTRDDAHIYIVAQKQ